MAIKDTILSKPKSTIHWVIIAIVVVIIILIIAQIYKAIKTASGVVGDMAGKLLVQQQTGITPERQDICAQIAKDADKGVYRLLGFGPVTWVTDGTIVLALNRCASSTETALVCQYYRENTGGSLKEIVEGGFFNETSRTRITYRNALT